jgi:hypothetical protein
MPVPPVGSDGSLRLPEHPELAFHLSQLSLVFLYNGEMRDQWMVYYLNVIRLGYRTDAVLVNTVAKVEPAGLAMVHRTVSKIPGFEERARRQLMLGNKSLSQSNSVITFLSRGDYFSICVGITFLC